MLRRITAILITTIISLVALELLLNLPESRPQTYSELYTNWQQPSPSAAPITYSDYLPFTLATSTQLAAANYDDSLYQTNALGYRGTYPTQIEKPEGTIRVLLLGDSFTFGHFYPLEDIFPTHLQTALDEQLEQPVEVINAGYHNGYSPDAYYAYVMREGLALDPDIVIINIFNNNDIIDIQDNVWREVDPDTGAPLSLFTTRQYTSYRNEILSTDNLHPVYRTPILRESRLYVGLGRILYPYQPHNLVDIDIAKDRFATTIAALHHIETAYDVPVYVSSFPVAASVVIAASSEEPFIAQTFADNLPSERYQILPAFGLEYQIEGDGHFNEEGHRVYTETLLELIAPTLETLAP